MILIIASYQVCRLKSENTYMVVVNTVSSADLHLYLGIDDLKVLQEELIDVSSKWYNIGLQLNLQAGDLDNIKLTEHVDVRSCLCEMLKMWLRRGHPTWQLLVKALNSRSVSENDLAKQLKRKYCKKIATDQTGML